MQNNRTNQKLLHMQKNNKTLIMLNLKITICNLLVNIYKYMQTQIHQTQNKIQNQKPRPELKGIQKLFQRICLVLFFVLIFCIPGFLKFRHFCQSKNYYVFAIDSFIWCTIGFFIVFTVKYSYFSIMPKILEKYINPNYDAETKYKKMQFMLKLSYDTFFYLIATLASYITFRNQYWFPSAAGGCGACSQIYKQYPDWPSGKRTELQIYFCFQLGVHLFSIFELFVVKKNDKKFYEWMLHHFMAASLILFSMMCNEITAGVMILIIHDASDIFMAGSRVYFEAAIKKNKLVTGAIIFMLFFSWIYLRIIVFPFCLLANVYINKPLPTDQWYIIHWQYLYLLTMAFVLFGMHLYWTFCLIKSAIISLGKERVVNDFDSEKRK